MLRDATEPGRHTPPPDTPPRDYAEPAFQHRPLHPVRRGLAAAWGVIGAIAGLMGLPFAIVAVVCGAIWWEVMKWLTRQE